MKGQKVLACLLLILLTFALAGCQNAPVRGASPSEPEPVHEIIDMESWVETYDDYAFAAHFPVTPHPRVNIAVKNEVERRLEAFAAVVAEAQPIPDEQRPFNLTLDFSLDYLAPDVLSFSLWELSDVGGANLRHDLATFNFDGRREKLLSLDDIFLADSNYLARLSSLAQGALVAQEELADYTDDQWLAQGAAPVAENFRHFLLTGEGIVFYFDRYQVAAGAAGNPRILLTYEELEDLLDWSALPPSLSAGAGTVTEPDPADGSAGEKTLGDGEEAGAPDLGEPGSPGTPKGKPGSSSPATPNAGDDVTPGDENQTGGSTDQEEPQGSPTKRIALTFDDGPHKNVTPFILDELLARDAKATFFVLGNRVEFYQDLVQRMVDEGHEIGNHSWNHADLTRLSEEEIQAQVANTQAAVTTWAGVEPTLLRPPYGAIDERVQALSPMPLVLWSVDTRDWETRNRDKIIRAALAYAHDGAIILFHDLYPTTAAAIGEIVDELQARGYELVTVSQLLGFDENESWAAFAGQTIRQLQ